MITLIVHTLYNIALACMMCILVITVSHFHSIGYGLTDVEHNLKVLDSSYGSTHGIGVQMFKSFGATLRQDMGRGNMMELARVLNALSDAISYDMIVSGFEMLSRWWIGAEHI